MLIFLEVSLEAHKADLETHNIHWQRYFFTDKGEAMLPGLCLVHFSVYNRKLITGISAHCAIDWYQDHRNPSRYPQSTENSQQLEWSHHLCPDHLEIRLPPHSTHQSTAEITILLAICLVTKSIRSRSWSRIRSSPVICLFLKFYPQTNLYFLLPNPISFLLNLLPHFLKHSFHCRKHMLKK